MGVKKIERKDRDKKFGVKWTVVFEPITFNEGFNVILGEIRLPENIGKDTHNLGKSKLAELIDFCFLKARNPNQFLFKHLDRFKHFAFFLEIKLNSGGFITVRRAVSKNTKICIKRHDKKHQNFNEIAAEDWDYFEVPIDKAKLLLDALFDLKVIAPWDYRQAINYALRSQNDFNDVFKLSNFLGKHIHWKPYVGHVLGFNSDNLIKNYEQKESIKTLGERLHELRRDLGTLQGDDEEMLRELFRIKEADGLALQEQLDTFNFDEADVNSVKKLTEEIDEEIRDLNKMRYYLKSNLRKLQNTLDSSGPTFSSASTKKLFEEAGILFGEQIVRSYDDLCEFNKKITIERDRLVKKEIKEIQESLSDASDSITELNKQKSQHLSFLNNAGTFEKFKDVTAQLISITAEMNEIKRKLSLSEQIKKGERDIRQLERDNMAIVDKIQDDKDKVLESETSIYKSIKTHFVDFGRVHTKACT